jgi:hypothetical protein
MRRALAPIAALVLVLGTVGNAAASSEASSDHAKLYFINDLGVPPALTGFDTPASVPLVILPTRVVDGHAADRRLSGE